MQQIILKSKGVQIRSEVDNVSYKETYTVITPTSEIQVTSFGYSQNCHVLASVRGQRMDIDTQFLSLVRTYPNAGNKYWSSPVYPFFSYTFIFVYF